jgi:hypothetical protein
MNRRQKGPAVLASGPRRPVEWNNVEPSELRSPCGSFKLTHFAVIPKDLLRQRNVSLRRAVLGNDPGVVCERLLDSLEPLVLRDTAPRFDTIANN